MRLQRRHWVWILAGGLVVLVAIGASLLVGNHRKDRLEEAFRTLAAGIERLQDSDTKGARAQFKESADDFKAAGRDPLLALHHAFAADLRSLNADNHGVRDLTIPHGRAAETVLALALSDDSSYLVVATTDRLLCLRA